MNSICLLSLCLIVFHLNKVRNIILFILHNGAKNIIHFSNIFAKFYQFWSTKVKPLSWNSTQVSVCGGLDRELAFWSEAHEFESRLWQLEKQYKSLDSHNRRFHWFGSPPKTQRYRASAVPYNIGSVHLVSGMNFHSYMSHMWWSAVVSILLIELCNFLFSSLSSEATYPYLRTI